ncbi:hypothetical protein NHX12_021474 [Muraenolepis orangiensis]|uniref:Uncharacterized protein n=1 Tax=Muraenolepis orangiensis TaxID=630683 RepID=A0A9Q0EQ92_9TELE|nr:hypothetical protein NHX12_021474 [Muraenolepis orangiensis]
MAQLSPCASPGTRRRSDGSVRECLFFPVLERNEQERLEALVRRRAGAAAADKRGRDPLENRPKRWTWGGPPDGAEASSGTQRPHRSSSNRRSIAGFLEENTGDKTPVNRRVRSTKNRALSPCSPGQYPPSPVRHRAPTPGSEDRGHADGKGHGTLERKSSKAEGTEKKIPNVGGTTDAEEASRLLAERRRLARRIEEIMKRTRKTDGDLPSPAPVSDARSPTGPVGEDEAPTPAEAPNIMLGPLETKSCLDELSDGVQSMDVSPVSRDDQASAQDFSPVTEGSGDVPYSLEHMSELSLRGPPGDTPAYPKLRAGSGAALGDLNKNLLIQAYSAASESSQLIHSLGPGKLDVQ